MEVIKYNQNIYNIIIEFINDSRSDIIKENFIDPEELRVLMPEWLRYYLLDNIMKHYGSSPKDNLEMLGMKVYNNYNDKVIVCVDRHRPNRPIFKELDLSILIIE